MMACICWGCKSKNMNTVTNEEAESTIVENSNDIKTNDNESKEENTEESAVKLSDYKFRRKYSFYPFYHSKGL